MPEAMPEPKISLALKTLLPPSERVTKARVREYPVRWTKESGERGCRSGGLRGVMEGEDGFNEEVFLGLVGGGVPEIAGVAEATAAEFGIGVGAEGVAGEGGGDEDGRVIEGVIEGCGELGLHGHWGEFFVGADGAEVGDDAEDAFAAGGGGLTGFAWPGGSGGVGEEGPARGCWCPASFEKVGGAADVDARVRLADCRERRGRHGCGVCAGLGCTVGEGGSEEQRWERESTELLQGTHRKGPVLWFCC